ncbi:Midasin [Manis pentadactyla]|nr:Midasin [Manis pentadactyla]
MPFPHHSEHKISSRQSTTSRDQAAEGRSLKVVIPQKGGMIIQVWGTWLTPGNKHLHTICRTTCHTSGAG